MDHVADRAAESTGEVQEGKPEEILQAVQEYQCTHRGTDPGSESAWEHESGDQDPESNQERISGSQESHTRGSRRVFQA